MEICIFPRQTNFLVKLQRSATLFLESSQLNFFFSKKFVKRKQFKITNMILQRPEILCRFVFTLILNIMKNLYSILFFSALMVVTASSLLPEDFREPLSIVKDSIMYSDNCEQFVCWRNMSLLLKMNYELKSV